MIDHRTIHYVKTKLLRYTPGLYFAISGYRSQKRCRKIFGQFQKELRSKLYGDEEIIVLSGPFSEMRYFNKIVWGPITPKWIGSYEEELHPALYHAIQAGYQRIIDIGAAEGYYAVGMARALPTAEVFAFDIDPFARRHQSFLRELNQVRNLKIECLCSTHILNKLSGSNCLVICDIEGAELQLLSPEIVPNLLFSDILVEIHAIGLSSESQVKEEIVRRFSKSHDIEVIASRRRIVSEMRNTLPHLQMVDDQILEDAMNEHRNNGLTWLWMRSHGAANEA